MKQRNVPDMTVTRGEQGMSALAGLFLLLLAYALHRQAWPMAWLDALLPWALGAIWLLIIFEAIWVMWQTRDTSAAAWMRLLVLCLLPPYRLALSPGVPQRLWLPGFGWMVTDDDTLERLDRDFSVPMLLIALLILPVLGLEYLWADTLASRPWLSVTVGVATALIWLAFAAEFIVMSRVAEKKIPYLLRHWINLAVILLPFLAFLRGLQMARLLRLGRMGRVLRVYRLKSLGIRAWQGVVMLQVLERLLYRNPQRRLAHLRARLAEREEEVQQLRQQVSELEARIAQQHAAQQPGESASSVASSR